MKAKRGIIATDEITMDTDEETLNGITEKVIGAAFTVHNTLGAGFAEKVYANALAHELRKAGMAIQQEMPIVVEYDGVVVGEYFGDLPVERNVLVEIKAVRSFGEAHTAQCLNYLTATRVPICLLLNFGRKVEIKRFRGQ